MPVFAVDGALEMNTVLVTAVVVGFVLGMFRGIEYLVKKYSSNGKPAAPAHWSDATGELRPVITTECSQRHEQLTRELAKGSDRMAALGDSVREVRTDVQDVKTEVLKLQSAVGAETELRIKETAEAAASKAISIHERSALHKNKTADYRKP